LEKIKSLKLRDKPMFSSRFEAGRLLAEKLAVKVKRAILLAIPRGGVIVADSIRKNLGWLLSLVVTKKLSAPRNEELAIGAVGGGKTSVFLNKELISQLRIDNDYLNQEISSKLAQVKERQKRLASYPKPPLEGKKVILVDDGIATGATVIAAIRQVREEAPDEVIVAVPVISRSALGKVKEEADRVIYLESPELFFSVSQFYRDFKQTSDEEVKRILATQE